MKILDLSGLWRYETDEADVGLAEERYKGMLLKEGFRLPGSTCENGIGIKQEYYEELTKEAVRAPRERYEYVAPLWLQREILVPEEWEGKALKLYLERVNIASQLWIDGEPINRQIIELSVPHMYNLTGRLSAGRHVLTLRIDNRNLLNIGTMASGYSIDTQGYWNGIIGRVELQCEELFHVENIQVYPRERGIDIRLVQTSDMYTPMVTQKAIIGLTVITPDGQRLETKIQEIEVYYSRQPKYFSYELEDIQYWDEFSPALYRLIVTSEYAGVTEEQEVSFGMRTICSADKKLLLNGRQLALRGTTDCAIYPLTGYPPMEKSIWKKNFRTIKSYGMNYVRFHAWCPPEAAFVAADEEGLYLSVEMPLWLNRDVCGIEVGEDSSHYSYYVQEARLISKMYGNHPSFLMFSNGNENMGDFELLDDIVRQIKACDNRRIYTLTTNFDHPVLPCEDYLCAFEAGGHKIRIQDIHDRVAEDTGLDYREAMADVPVPILSFEIGQYCVYPDVRGIEKYTGNMLPVNFDVIKKQMEKKGVSHRLDEYVRASGDLAVKLYKEDIEAALRTKDFGGFELLSLCDYTGQSTATVGILDAFFDSKGLIEPQNFCDFCNSVVPLFKAKRIFKNTEILDAELDIYDYGREQIEEPVFKLVIRQSDTVFYEIETTDRKVSIPLEGVTKSALLKVILSVNGYTNSWNVFVFTEEAVIKDSAEGRQENMRENMQDITVREICTIEELKQMAKTGGRAILTADCLKDWIEGSFIPVFWSPVFFPSQKPCGAIIDEKHPLFIMFPTERYPDYQWKRLLESAKCMNISGFQEKISPVVEMVPNFVDNTPSSPLWEARIGKADIVFCGFDLSEEVPEVQAFKNALYQYLSSDDFCPKQEVSYEAVCKAAGL